MEKNSTVIITQEETELQNYYINKVSEITSNYPKKLLFSQNVYGCQMNAHDSEKIEALLVRMGYAKASNEKEADIIIYNTCCVRENAENKVYGNLGCLKPLKAENKNLKIVLCGCMMQQDTVIDKIRQSYKYVDIIFGTFNLHRFPQLLYTSFETNSQIIDVWKEHKEVSEDLKGIRASKFKSSVNIMYGCNNFCSYCIVPYVRGRERSRSPKDITTEIKNLVNDGVKEITLLGQNVNSYTGGGITFPELLKGINEIEGLEKIRFMTSHPKDLSDELIEVIKTCDKICKYVHLPIQSGSNNILKKMNRKYTKESYLEIVEKLRIAVPNITISTDIIVGFPTETEEDFLETLDVARKVRFSTAFTFIYSKRTGTPAASMDNHVPEGIIKDRFNRLLDVINSTVNELSKEHLGKTLEVMAEEVNKQDSSLLTGRADDNSIVHFKADKSLLGKISNVKIINYKTFYLIGELI